MTMKMEYQEYLGRREAYATEVPMSQYFLDNYSRFVEPFRIYGNLYFVGDSWVCVHLIDTGDGLLLLDGGNVGATAMLVHSIWKLGFDPANVRWMVLSHGHLDHIGGVEFMRKLFGTQILMGKPDAEMFQKYPERSFIQQGTDFAQQLFQPDRTIEDGDSIKFGGTTVEFRLVPGHSAGAIACFFPAVENGITKRVEFYGGFGFNTLTKSYLEEIGDLQFTMRTTYLNSLQKVRNEKVDIFIGNHTDDVNLEQKREIMRKNPRINPFVDGAAWSKYLDKRKAALLNFMADPANN